MNSNVEIYRELKCLYSDIFFRFMLILFGISSKEDLKQFLFLLRRLKLYYKLTHNIFVDTVPFMKSSFCDKIIQMYLKLE